MSRCATPSVPCAGRLRGRDHYRAIIGISFEKEADALNHWGNWEIFHRLATTRYEKARQLWEQYCLPFEEELILHKDSLEHREITAQAFDTGWKLAKKMASLLQESPVETGLFNRRYWKKKERESF